MGIFKKRAPAPKGYTVLKEGNFHLCGLPPAKQFSPGTIIRCDECGLEYVYYVNWASGPDWLAK